MNKIKQKISTRQAAILIVYTVVGDMILIIPGILANLAKQDAWVSALAGIPAGIILLWMFFYLSCLFPGLSLVGICRRVFGKWLGNLVSAWYMFFFACSTAVYIREIGDFITVQILRDTPIRAVHLLFVFLLLYGFRKGLEPIARTAELLFFLFILGLISMVVLGIQNIDFANLKPVLQEGLLPVIHGSLFMMLYPFGELCVFLMIFPYVRQQSHTRRDLLLGGLLGGLLVASYVVDCLLILGAFFTSYQHFPSYVLAQKINIGNFLERIEVVLAINWILAVFLKGTLYFFAFVKGMGELTKTRRPNSLAVPAAFLIFGLSYIIAPNMMYYTAFIPKFYIYWDFTNGVLLPLLLLLVALIRTKVKPEPQIS
ncbi:germination protein [Paenibacillus albidus]|uniref:Germination protein n=1 Tax=Paenibacillus albidus TaxID=2041023 RepID=A0A917CCQ9_9BACL|nr:endospore germination permease [Paenibacillus albidus]GGF84597.1 germination protein [Paenibacillus albidus]